MKKLHAKELGGEVVLVVACPSMNVVVLATADVLVLYRTSDFSQLASIPVKGVVCATWSAMGRVLAAGTTAGELLLVDPGTSEVLRLFTPNAAPASFAAAMPPNMPAPAPLPSGLAPGKPIATATWIEVDVAAPPPDLSWCLPLPVVDPTSPRPPAASALAIADAALDEWREQCLSLLFVADASGNAAVIAGGMYAVWTGPALAPIASASKVLSPSCVSLKGGTVVVKATPAADKGKLSGFSDLYALQLSPVVAAATSDRVLCRCFAALYLSAAQAATEHAVGLWTASVKRTTAHLASAVPGGLLCLRAGLSAFCLRPPAKLLERSGKPWAVPPLPPTAYPEFDVSAVSTQWEQVQKAYTDAATLLATHAERCSAFAESFCGAFADEPFDDTTTDYGTTAPDPSAALAVGLTAAVERFAAVQALVGQDKAAVEATLRWAFHGSPNSDAPAAQFHPRLCSEFRDEEYVAVFDFLTARIAEKDGSLPTSPDAAAADVAAHIAALTATAPDDDDVAPTAHAAVLADALGQMPPVSTLALSRLHTTVAALQQGLTMFAHPPLLKADSALLLEMPLSDLIPALPESALWTCTSTSEDDDAALVTAVSVTGDGYIKAECVHATVNAAFGMLVPSDRKDPMVEAADGAKPGLASSSGWLPDIGGVFLATVAAAGAAGADDVHCAYVGGDDEDSCGTTVLEGLRAGGKQLLSDSSPARGFACVACGRRVIVLDLLDVEEEEEGED